MPSKQQVNLYQPGVLDRMLVPLDNSHPRLCGVLQRRDLIQLPEGQRSLSEKLRPLFRVGSLRDLTELEVKVQLSGATCQKPSL